VNKRTKRINIQKEFLEKFALLKGIKNPSDWNEVALKEIKKHDSPFPPKKIELIKALKRVYPGSKFNQIVTY
jgi:hypothetical protein